MSEKVRIKDTQLVFMGRAVENFFGEGALDKLMEHKLQEVKDTWSEIAEETEREDPGYLLRLFTDEVHDYEVIENSEDCLEVVVKECKHAEVFNSFCAADLGEKMVCSGDFAVVEGFNSDIQLERPETAMKGDVCRFKFKLSTEGDESHSMT